MLRFAVRTLALTALCALATISALPTARSQEKNSEEKNSSEKNSQTQKNSQNPTAEQVAETVILFYGQRPILQQVRRSGTERGVITRTKSDGGSEEITYERRFMRGDSSAKDKIRLDQKTPVAEYSLVFNDGRFSGIINGVNFTPRQEAQTEFLTATHYDIDPLLRYKEDKSQLTLVGKEKQKNIDMFVLDLVDTDKRRTRYYISAQRARVLWLEYEQPAAAGTAPTKYKRTFHDYAYVQGTLVPFRTVTYADGKLLDEKRIRTVTYGVKMDDSIFNSGE